MRARDDHGQRPRLQPHDAAIAKPVTNGNGIALTGGHSINRALNRGAEIFIGTFVESHFQVPESDLGFHPGGKHLQFPLEDRTGDDMQPQAIHGLCFPRSSW